MRTIKFNDIVTTVSNMCIESNHELPKDVILAIKNSIKKEKSAKAKRFLHAYLKNQQIAKAELIPICQDTGISVFFVEVGQDVQIKGGTLEDAINKGVAKGYKEGYLRKSVVKDPFFDRKNTGNNTPAIIHTKTVKGSKLKIICMPKGAGSENMSAIKMFSPSANEHDITDFILDTVLSADSNPCPPIILGIGIGGNFEKCALLSKYALARKVGTKNKNKKYQTLEQRILKKINSTNIGPQGQGGATTCLAVHIETYPCHIASLPVAINIGCHVNRHVEKII
jgi:fumarate hydratase subunit alpha